MSNIQLFADLVSDSDLTDLIAAAREKEEAIRAWEGRATMVHDPVITDGDLCGILSEGIQHKAAQLRRMARKLRHLRRSGAHI